MNCKLARAIIVTITVVYCSVCPGVEIPDGPFFGQEPPGLTSEIFAPSIISISGRFEDGVTFTPGGLECCVAVTNSVWSTSRIDYAHYVNGQWTTPSRAYFTPGGINGTCQFGPDGLGFYFVSMSTGNQDVWVSRRDSMQDRWSSASLIPYPVSPGNSREFAPSVTIDGTIYFTSSRGGGHGANDIWRSPYVNGRYSTVENVGPPVNTGAGEQSSFIAPDESYLIFTSSGHGGNFGSTDLYISFRDENDTWTEPINMGPEINTANEERTPFVSFDGKYLFYTRRSNSDADIYWVDTRAFLPDPNGAVENLSSGQRFASIQCAVNYANNGEVILLQPGIYHESVNLRNKNIILQSADPNDPSYIGGTIIQGSADKPVITLQYNSEACEIAGLTIRAGLSGIAGTGTDVTIRNCRIMDNINHGLELSRRSEPHLLNCLITGNGQTGIMNIANTGRNISACAPLIENCVIVQNGSANITGGEPIIIDSIVSQ